VKVLRVKKAPKKISKKVQHLVRLAVFNDNSTEASNAALVACRSLIEDGVVSKGLARRGEQENNAVEEEEDAQKPKGLSPEQKARVARKRKKKEAAKKRRRRERDARLIDRRRRTARAEASAASMSSKKQVSASSAFHVGDEREDGSVLMPSKKPGRCASCRRAYKPGMHIWWNKQARVGVHKNCSAPSTSTGPYKRRADGSILMRSRYSGSCAFCLAPFVEGSLIWWYPETRYAVHENCSSFGGTAANKDYSFGDEYQSGWWKRGF
jgi:hypothetical protein